MNTAEFQAVVDSLCSVMKSFYEYLIRKIGSIQLATNKQLVYDSNFELSRERALELLPQSMERELWVYFIDFN